MFTRNGQKLGSVQVDPSSADPRKRPRKQRAEAKSEEPDPTTEVEAEAEDQSEDDQKPELEIPAHGDLKQDWVDYVVAKTANSDKPVSAEEADAMNKADLIKEFGG